MAKPIPSNVGLDVPLRLDVAAALAFPDGSMTGNGLRREAARGNLAIERIAGKDYTTLFAIQEMRNKCRVQPKAPASTSKSAPAARRSGSSETEKSASGLAAMLRIGQAPKKRSDDTSPKSTNPSSQVVTLPSRT